MIEEACPGSGVTDQSGDGVGEGGRALEDHLAVPVVVVIRLADAVHRVQVQHHDLPQVVLVHVPQGVIRVRDWAHQPLCLRGADRVGHELVDLVAQPPAHHQLPVSPALGVSPAVQVLVGDGVDGGAVPFNDVPDLIGAFAGLAVDVDLQGRGIVGSGGPEKGHRLLYAVPVQVHELDGLGIGPLERAGIFSPSAADQIDLLLEVLVVLRCPGHRVELLRRTEGTPAQQQQKGGQGQCPNDFPLSHSCRLPAAFFLSIIPYLAAVWYGDF